MANHGHALSLPEVSPQRLLGVRDAREFERIAAYIENNPLKAGFVARPEDYPWSSVAKPAARDGKSAAAASTSACATSTAGELPHTPRA